MKIKPEQVNELAALLLRRYQAKELLTAKTNEAEIKARIAKVVSQNMAEEEAIEEEARRMLASHAGAAREMDSHKMFLLAKQKLAAKKGFIL